MKKFFDWGFLGIIIAISKEIISHFFRHKPFETTDFLIDIIIVFFVFGLASFVLFKNDSLI